MEVIYTTSALPFSRTCELSQRVRSDRLAMSFPSHRSKMPQVFTFEPIHECEKPKRRKKRSLRVLYPPRQVRRPLPTEKDITKRLLLFFLSVVILQVYIATEEELMSLPAPEPSAAEQSPAAASPSALSVVVLPRSLGDEANCSSQQRPSGGHSLQATRIVLSCKM
ncbi:hypothetical protein chiPu_0020216 [Chiloscyllium punctatum]|uniref:Radiation-inducible immediate-early gene IEX-1 n=1 Tax=Chiloscyllium punctatum TaxID=137246 RepID=A0A401RUG0_CHIPU|nr:hypothetical protein [Chiloscyllium punctatum]